MSEELADRPAVWPVHDSRPLVDTGWVVGLREDVISRPGHAEETFTRWTLEHPGAVVVLAVDDEERVLCLRQYRHSNEQVFVELPAGLKDVAGESAIDTAARELREEAELSASDWRLLLSTYSSAGITTEVHDIFLARGLAPAPRGEMVMEHEEAELEVLWAPMSELLEAVLAGRVRQGPLVQAVLAYDVLSRRDSLAPR
jgi:ADP-ribose pyrophosphatase